MLEDLKKNSNNAGPLFQLLLKCYLQRPDVSMAVIQVLESFLSTLEPAVVRQLRAAFVCEFLEKQILSDPNVSVPSCKKIILKFCLKSFLDLRNKICQFLVTAFVTETCQGTWPDAISSLISLAEKSQVGQELFLRWCLMLTERIASQRPQPRTDSTHQQNTKVRDFLRLGDNGKLTALWKRILQSSTTCSVSTCLALECFAQFAHWIDVSLVVETETLKLIYTHLQSDNASIQLAASDCLAEVVTKGMQVSDKIALAAYMNLDSVFTAVGERGMVDAFFGRVCKILNNLGFSLIFALQNQSIARAQVIDWCSTSLLPHLLRFSNVLAQSAQKNLLAAHESSLWSEALASLLPVSTSFFELARSCKEDLRPEFSSFATHFLPILLKLAERSDSELLEAGEDDSLDEEDEFMTAIRPALLLYFDSIASMQGHATLSLLNSRRGETGVSLSRIELLLQLILRLPEALRTPPDYVTCSDSSPKSLTPTGELVTWACQIGSTLDVANRPLPNTMSLLAAEVIVRYSSTAFLDVVPEQIDVCLRALVNTLEATNYGVRAADLMLRFIKNLKGKLSSYASALLSLLQGHLASGRVRSAALFEAAGLAVSALDSSNMSLNSATASLLQVTLQRALVLAPGEDVSRAAEGIELLGAFARGFTTESCADPASVRAWFTDLLGLLRGSELLVQPVYQSAVIGLLQRTIPLCQSDCLSLIEEISMRILKSSDPDCAALALLIPLHSAAIFKLRENFTCPQVLGALWSQVVDCSRRALDMPASGTDDILNQAALCKVFLALLQAVIGSSAASSCTLTLRQAPLEAVLHSIAQFIGRSVDVIDAVALLRSLCGGIQKALPVLAPDFVYSTAIPFLFSRLLPVIFSHLEASVKVHLQALPASIHQLVNDALALARAAQQHEPQPGLVAAALPVSIASGDLKEIKVNLLTFYIQ